MAIITEHYEINGRKFIRTYSDAGREVVRDGIAYAEANDPAEFGRTYTEGDLLPTDDGTETNSDAEEIVNILTGGAS